MQKSTKIVLSVLGALIVIVGGWYLYASHAVASHVPGHVYQYTAVAGNQKAYMAFAKQGDRVVVTPNKGQALKATQSAQAFDQVYQDNIKQGEWNYRAQGSHLTLTKTLDHQTSLWQYNHVLVLGTKLHASSFTYQIAHAGQGIDKRATNFERIN